jgi:hypothetical protein
MQVVKLQDVKGDHEIVLPGVEVVLVKENGSLKEIGLIAEGATYTIRSDYGLRFLRPADPVMVTKYRATVEIKGKTLELGLYDDEWSAKNENNDVKDVTVTEVQVEERGL